MPTVSRNAPPAATPTASPTPAPAPQAPAASTPAPPAPAAPKAPRAAPINGLAGLTSAVDLTSNRFSRDTLFDGYSDTGAGPVERGYLRCQASPIPGGCRVEVQTFHHNQNDALTLFLQAEVLDTQKSQLHTITLAVLAKEENMNGAAYRGSASFDLSYDAINKFLQARNPALKITPGTTTLAVAGLWPGGHQAGGFGRTGTFRLPPDARVKTTAPVATTSAAKAEKTDLPLDMQVAYPRELTSEIPQLKPDGDILSRLESELKGVADEKEMTSAVKTLYRLAEGCAKGDTKEAEKLLGKGWSLTTANRYWVKDDGTSGLPGKPGTGFFKGFRVNAEGLPLQDPMHDVYLDDTALGMTRHEGAIRLRKNQQATVVNVKPGAGRRDEKTRITQRIEVGLEMKPEATTRDAGDALSKLASGDWSGTVFNHAQKEVRKLDPKLTLEKALVPWVEVTQDRHKFTARQDSTGVEIELSFDWVDAHTVRSELAKPDGLPRTARFCVLEAELDHLQLASKNKASFAAGAAAGAARASSSAHFATDSQQDLWLKSTGKKVTLDIDPRLHELEDLANASFRSTASYRSFEEVAKRLVPALFPNGLGAGHQKAAHAAQAMGLLPEADSGLLQSVRAVVENGGYKWTPALKAALDAVWKTPAAQESLAKGLLDGTQRNPLALLSQVLPSVPLEYDLGQVKARVQGRLRQLGLEAPLETLAWLDSLTAEKVKPQNFESYLQQMQAQPDAQVLSSLATALGAPAPAAPKSDARLLLGNTEWGRKLRDRLEAAWVDSAQLPELEDFFTRLAKAGATAFELRGTITSLGQNAQQQLDQLAQTKGVTPVPKLRASVNKLVLDTEKCLRGQHLTSGPELRGFLQAVSNARPLSEALKFAQSLTSNASALIQREAKRLKVKPPTLGVDLAAVDAAVSSSAMKAHVVYDPGLKDFVHECVRAGVPVSQFQSAFGWYLKSDFASALKECGVFVVGLKVPELNYDLGATELAIRSGVGATNPLIPSAGLKKLCEGLVAAGVPAPEVVKYATTASKSGWQSAASALAIPLDSPPALPIDLEELTKALKAVDPAQWTPALEKYVKAVLPKAVESPTFALATVVKTTGKPLALALQQMTGIAPPPGL